MRLVWSNTKRSKQTLSSTFQGLQTHKALLIIFAAKFSLTVFYHSLRFLFFHLRPMVFDIWNRSVVRLSSFSVFTFFGLLIHLKEVNCVRLISYKAFCRTIFDI